MHFDTVAQIDAAIREALARIARQCDFVEEFAAKGYDMRAPLSLLSYLLINLRRLEHQRRDLAVGTGETARA